MNANNSETSHELDCEVTVDDGAYMTCDMIEEPSADEQADPADYHI